MNKTYASNFSYTAHGGASSMRLGNNLWEHTNYNSRLQPTQIGLGTTSTGTASTSVLGLDYTFRVKVSGTLDATKNNGNVESQTITAPNGSGGTTSMVQSYTYDQVNRLLTAGEGSAWTQNCGYDIFGNRWVSGYHGVDTLPHSCLPQERHLLQYTMILCRSPIKSQRDRTTTTVVCRYSNQPIKEKRND